MSNVDRNSPIPLYYQIAMDLRTRVKWEWGYGAKLPNEPDLAEEYGTSRMTVRQAMAELVKDGTLIRKRAKGTFVRDEPSSFIHTLTLPFRSRLQSPGIVITSKILQAEVQKVESKEVSKYLEISHDTHIAYFRRLFMANNQPVAINQSMIPEKLCPEITSSSLINDSISTTLSQRYNLKPTMVDGLVGSRTCHQKRYVSPQYISWGTIAIGNDPITN